MGDCPHLRLQTQIPQSFAAILSPKGAPGRPFSAIWLGCEVRNGPRKVRDKKPKWRSAAFSHVILWTVANRFTAAGAAR